MLIVHRCVSGGERKKMWCAFESADKKYYMLDMKTTSSKAKCELEHKMHASPIEVLF